MMRTWEVPVFFGVALALHAAAFLATTGKGQDAAPGGAGGTGTVTVAAASPQIVAMVENWENPPEIAEPLVPQVAEPPVPEAPARPQVAETPSPPGVPRPQMAAIPVSADLPDIPSLPSILENEEPEPEPEAVMEPEPEPEPEPESEPQTALAEAERPAPRPEEMVAVVAPPPDPEPQPEPQQGQAGAVAQEARPELRAAGTGGDNSGGQGQAAVATDSGRGQADPMATWGAQIQQRLQRALVYPRQAEMRRITGVAMVALTVASDGRVQARQLVGSSGSPILDEAALSTVDRARGLPPAPQALGAGSFTFQLPVRFDAR